MLTPAGEQEGGGFSGDVLALYITVLVVYLQAVTQLPPFAMGISLSRRTFYLGTALVAVVRSIFYGMAIAVLPQIENATGGWGNVLSFWAPGPFEVDDFTSQVLTSGAPMLAFTFIGVGMGVVHKRGGPPLSRHVTEQGPSCSRRTCSATPDLLFRGRAPDVSMGDHRSVSAGNRLIADEGVEPGGGAGAG